MKGKARGAVMLMVARQICSIVHPLQLELDFKPAEILPGLILFVKTHPDSQRTSAFWVLSLCSNSAVNVAVGTDGHQAL